MKTFRSSEVLLARLKNGWDREMSQGTPKIIWIVGASTGIGAALARLMAEQPNTTIIISARREEALAQLSEPFDNLIPLEMDITSQPSIRQAINHIHEAYHHIDQLILNAGVCEYIEADSLSLETTRSIFETNFFGMVGLLEASYALLRKSTEPQVVAVSSSVTYAPLPRGSAYGASKAALRYFLESLKLDWQHLGIDIRIVSPGFVETPLTQQNDFPMPAMISSEEAAHCILKGLNTKQHDIHFPKRFTLSLRILRYLPDRLYFWLIGKTSRYSSGAKK